MRHQSQTQTNGCEAWRPINKCRTNFLLSPVEENWPQHSGCLKTTQCDMDKRLAKPRQGATFSRTLKRKKNAGEYKKRKTAVQRT